MNNDGESRGALAWSEVSTSEAFLLKDLAIRVKAPHLSDRGRILCPPSARQYSIRLFLTIKF
jgi:hypothetical protein